VSAPVLALIERLTRERDAQVAGHKLTAAEATTNLLRAERAEAEVARLREALHSRQRFQIGDPVEVSSTYANHRDWTGTELFVSGVIARMHTGEASYEVSSEWPPLQDRTDGWSETDLSPRALQPRTQSHG